MLDVDRHASGLFCYANDHQRTLLQPDPEVPPFQKKLATEDILTDSESDDDEETSSDRVKPSIEMVKSILSKPIAAEEPVKGKASKPKTTISPRAASSENEMKGDSSSSALLQEGEKRNEQVGGNSY